MIKEWELNISVSKYKKLSWFSLTNLFKKKKIKKNIEKCVSNRNSLCNTLTIHHNLFLKSFRKHH